MAAPALKLSSLEAERAKRLAHNTPLPSRFAEAANDDVETDDEPVFGEEEFGSMERKKPESGGRQSGGQQNASAPSADAMTERFLQRTASLRQAGYEAANDNEEDPSSDTGDDTDGEGLNQMQQAFRDGIDMGMGKAMLSFPVIGHLCWWNLKMIYGSWLRKGRGKLVGPFTFNDILAIAKFGGKAGGGAFSKGGNLKERLIAVGKEQKGTQKSGGDTKDIVPRSVMHGLLVSADLVIAFVALAVIALILYWLHWLDAGIAEALKALGYTI